MVGKDGSSSEWGTPIDIKIGSSAEITDVGSCCETPAGRSGLPAHLVEGVIATDAGPIPRVKTALERPDILGGWQARWGINRMKYTIPPGLYAVGEPNRDSPVLVTANYKLTFDRLRQELAGLNTWIMVLDTKGINVWCAAGKGAFSTEEIVRRLHQVRLAWVVSHRTLILPQLGAPGVAAHEVTRRTGFKVVYGPIRARDLPEFINKGMKTNPAMRQVRFDLQDRLVVTPIELVATIKPLLIILTALYFLNTIKPGPMYTLGIVAGTLAGFIPYLGAVVIGSVVVPILLPWIPGRAFSWKGWLLGMIWAVMINTGIIGLTDANWRLGLANLLILPAISSFLALNFTGATTYTSLSGVKKEMRLALPAILGSLAAGIVLIIADKIMEFLI